MKTKIINTIIIIAIVAIGHFGVNLVSNRIQENKRLGIYLEERFDFYQGALSWRRRHLNQIVDTKDFTINETKLPVLDSASAMYFEITPKRSSMWGNFRFGVLTDKDTVFIAYKKLR